LGEPETPPISVSTQPHIFDSLPTWPIIYGGGSGRVSKRVAVSRTDKVELLRRAANEGTSVKITGSKVDGTRFYERLVNPNEVEERRVGYGGKENYLRCFDPVVGEPRVFKVSLLDRVEVVS
jgi:hypothetical protein